MCNIDAARPTFSNRCRTSELRYSINVRSSSSTSFRWAEVLTAFETFIYSGGSILTRNLTVRKQF